MVPLVRSLAVRRSLLQLAGARAVAAAAAASVPSATPAAAAAAACNCSIAARHLTTTGAAAVHRATPPAAALPTVAYDHDADDEEHDVPAPVAAAATSPKKAKKSTMRVIRADATGWETVVGIEVHAQITAASKLFSPASTRVGAAPNAHAAYVDAALPGTLPTLNEHAVRQAVRTGLGLDGQVQTVSKFERKHYFYCDMPQGYQITQQQFPIVRGGRIVLDDGPAGGAAPRVVRITRIQLEQDSGKSLHDLHPTRSYVDLNRAGVGLMEIVSEADIRSSADAALYIRKLSSLLQSLGSCRAHMEDGSLRADVNVSIRRPGAEFGERVEVKNLNSLRSLQRAIEHEVARQIALADAGQPVARETRAFDAKTGVTILMRSKENMLDYRFAPEPDLPPLILPHSLVGEIQRSMPELPDAISKRYREAYGLSAYDVGVLLAEEGAPAFMDQLVYGPAGRDPALPKQPMLRSPKRCANWLANELFGRLKKMKQTAVIDVDPSEEGADEDAVGSFSGGGSRGPTLASSPVTSATLASLIDLVESEAVSGKVGKDVLDLLMQPGEERTPKQIVDENNWLQVTDHTLLDSLCEQVASAFPTEVAGAVGGNKRLFGFLAGQVLKTASAQSAAVNPSAASKRMMQLIEKRKAEAVAKP